MNKRLEQLLKEATKEEWGINQYNGAPELEGYVVDQEKFAELIVKECFNEIKKGVPLVSLAEDRVFNHFGITVNATKT